MAGDTLEEEKKGTEEDRKGSPFSAPPWPQLTKNRAEHEREGFWRVSVSWGRVRNSGLAAQTRAVYPQGSGGQCPRSEVQTGCPWPGLSPRLLCASVLMSSQHPVPLGQPHPRHPCYPLHPPLKPTPTKLRFWGPGGGASAQEFWGPGSPTGPGEGQARGQTLLPCSVWETLDGSPP